MDRKAEAVAELIAEVSSGAPGVRLRAAKSLREWSERAPGEVYPHFDFVAGVCSQNPIRGNV